MMNKTLRIIFTIVGVVAGLALLGFVFGRFGGNHAVWGGGMMDGGTMYGAGPGMMGQGFTTGWGNFGWLGMLLGWIVNLGLLFGVVWLITWFVQRVSPSNGTETTTPREILQARYARGEIAREQYLEILADL